MFMENFTKKVTENKVIYSTNNLRKLFKALEVYHVEGYKLAAGYNAKAKLYYMTLLR